MEQADSGKGLKRTLGPMNLIALGIGAIIGAGLFVRTAAAASDAAGPGVIVSYIIAGIGCAFAGLYPLSAPGSSAAAPKASRHSLAKPPTCAYRPNNASHRGISRNTL